MGNKLPIWSYSDSGNEEKIANCFPYYGQEKDNFCGMVKLGPVSSGWDEIFEKNDKNFIKKTSISLNLSDVVKRACGEDEFNFGDVIIGPISNERDENGDLLYNDLTISLSLDEVEQPQILDKEFEKGFYKGQTISYFSNFNDSSKFNQWVGIIWDTMGTGTSYEGTCTLECRVDGQEEIFLSQTQEGPVREFILKDLPMYNNDGEIVKYRIREVLSNSQWSVETNDLLIDGEYSEIGIFFTNTLNVN